MHFAMLYFVIGAFLHFLVFGTVTIGPLSWLIVICWPALVVAALAVIGFTLWVVLIVAVGIIGWILDTYSDWRLRRIVRR